MEERGWEGGKRRRMGMEKSARKKGGGKGKGLKGSAR